MEKYPYLVEFLKFYQLHREAPATTLSAYENGVKKFLNFMLDNYGFSDPARAEKHHFYKFKEYMVNACFAKNTITLNISAVRNYFAWLDECNYIVNNKMPDMSMAGGQESIPHYVPTIAEIFRIRYKRNIGLRKATCFELLMSTGMRSDEMRMLRACDFKFGERPNDAETGAPSKYFAGAIHLQPRKHRGKTRSSRKLYFSVLADMLLKKYFNMYNIPVNSHQPFCPWARQSTQDWMRELGEGVVAAFESQEEAEAGKVIQRDFSYRDVDIDNAALDPRMRELIKARQDKANSLPEYKQAAMKPERRKRHSLHPHSLRHFWMCAMHYRNPFGERRSEDRIRLMAGHSVRATTLGYLRDLDLIKTDEIWKRLWLGRPTDWLGLNEE